MKTVPFKPGRSIRVWLSVLMLLACTGCGEKRLPLSPVSGSLLVDDEPAAGALITFLPIEEERKFLPSFAHVEKDGSFQGGTYLRNDGIPPGNYLLAIEWPVEIPGSEEPGPDRLNGRFVRNPTLRISVKPTSNQLPPIRLESASR